MDDFGVCVLITLTGKMSNVPLSLNPQSTL